MMAVAAAIELQGIQKSFGNVHAVRGVSLRIEKGAITGIVGENGAGKSTLMSILYGLYNADAGEIRVEGRPVRMENPRDAIAHGIGMVHQHFMLVGTFTVLENLVLGAEGGPLLVGGLAAARAELARLERDYGLAVDPDALVADLSVGEQQRVEILKVLFRGARILILDEPSAVLTPQETDQLFRILAALKQRGVTVVLITHKLREIMAATDHVYVMRQGEIVADRRTAETSVEELAELMVGRKVLMQLDKAPRQPGAVLLQAEHLSLVDDRGVRLLDDIDLALRAGEIVGIAGVSGNGQTELLQVLSGIRAPTGGRLTVRGRTIDPRHPTDPAEMRDLGVAHVPEDRLRQGMVAAFEAAETSILGYQELEPFCHHYLMDGPAVGAHCAAAHGTLRRAAALARPALVELLRRQPAEAGAGARDGARAQGAAGRPADARRRHRRHRIHPSRAAEEPRPGLRRPRDLRRARRDPGTGRPHPGDVRRPDRGRGAGRAAPTSARLG